jgi:hypothetical protein
VETHLALIETLERGRKACEAKIGVEHGEGAGDLVGIGDDTHGAIAIRHPDFKALGEARCQRIGGVF